MTHSLDISQVLRPGARVYFADPGAHAGLTALADAQGLVVVTNPTGQAYDAVIANDDHDGIRKFGGAISMPVFTTHEFLMWSGTAHMNGTVYTNDPANNGATQWTRTTRFKDGVRVTDDAQKYGPGQALGTGPRAGTTETTVTETFTSYSTVGIVSSSNPRANRRPGSYVPPDNRRDRGGAAARPRGRRPFHLPMMGVVLGLVLGPLNVVMFTAMVGLEIDQDPFIPVASISWILAFFAILVWVIGGVVRGLSGSGKKAGAAHLSKSRSHKETDW